MSQENVEVVRTLLEGFARRDHERAFLENVGPLALAAAEGLADADTPADPALEPAIIDTMSEDRIERRGLVQRVKDWLRRAA